MWSYKCSTIKMYNNDILKKVKEKDIFPRLILSAIKNHLVVVTFSAL